MRDPLLPTPDALLIALWLLCASVLVLLAICELDISLLREMRLAWP